MTLTHVGPLDGPDDIPAQCQFCGKPGKLYIIVDPDNPDDVGVSFCKRHADRLFVKLGKLLGYVD